MSEFGKSKRNRDLAIALGVALLFAFGIAAATAHPNNVQPTYSTTQTPTSGDRTVTSITLACQSSTGAINCQVQESNAEGQPVPDVALQLLQLDNGNSNLVGTFTTDDNGYQSFTRLTPANLYYSGEPITYQVRWYVSPTNYLLSNTVTVYAQVAGAG